MPESPSASIIETVRTKCFIFDEALKIRDQKYKQNLRENCSTSTKMAVTAFNFQKLSVGACPRTP